MKILVTGASGFVGGALARRLAANSDYSGVVAAVRRSDLLPTNGLSLVQVGDLSSSTNWTTALQHADAVVHCAARVHVMHDNAVNPLEVYRQVNLEGTLNLASQAARAGVQRFVFVSSIKVNGESTLPGHPFTADDKPAPLDPYAVSKHEAEQGLRELSHRTGMSLVIVRPPLVYGPGVKANFASMMRLMAIGLPLPFGSIHNLRSMVALDNLVDLLDTCLQHQAAAGQTFLVSDNEDVSTSELLRRTAYAMNKRPFLLPVPTPLLKVVLSLLGKRSVAQRLCDSLQVDIEKTRRLLGWSPPLSLDQGLKKTVESIKW